MNKHAGQDDELRPEYDPSELLKGEVRDGHADRYRGYKQVQGKEDSMKKQTGMDDELRSEYGLSELLKGGVRGKYADRYREGTNLVLLAPDVAALFSR